MADNQIKIQTTSLDELSGGQRPLETDNPSPERRGNEFNQVFRSFPSAPEVQGRAAGLCSPAPNSRELASVSDMACDSPVAPNVRPVDARNLEGSYKGDTRAQRGDSAADSLSKAANGAGGPRAQVGQFPLGAKVPPASAPASFPADPDSDAGN